MVRSCQIYSFLVLEFVLRHGLMFFYLSSSRMVSCRLVWFCPISCHFQEPGLPDLVAKVQDLLQAPDQGLGCDLGDLGWSEGTQVYKLDGWSTH